MRDGIGFLRTPVAGVELTLQGTLSGAGGFGVSGPASGIAYVVLTGANSYTGPTIVQGALAFASDAALGNGGALELGGTAPRLRLDGPWTSARSITINGTATLDTNGFDAVWRGELLNTTGSLTKRGLGTLTLESDTLFTSTLTAAGGMMLLNGNGATNGGFSVNSGATIRFDNTTNAMADRIGDASTLTLGSGRIELLGHATIPIRETTGAVSLSSGAHGTLALTAPGSARTILDAGSYSVSGGDSLVTFAGVDGGSTRVTFRAAPTLTGGLLPRAIVDSGGVENLATYNAATDAAGAVGVRALRPAEYLPGTLVQNPANGGATPASANFLLNAPGTALGTASTLNSLTFASGSSLSLAPDQSLTLTAEMIFTPRGVSGASITGGTLLFPGGTGVFAGDGDLLVGSRLGNTGARFIKAGTGTLTFTGDAPNNTSSFTVAGGRLRPGAGAPLGVNTVTVNAGATLEVAGVTTRVGGVAGAGTLLLTSGELQIGPAFSASTFTGQIVGPGALTFTGHSFTYQNAATHTGPTSLTRGGTITLSGGGTMLATSELRLSGLSTLTLNNSAAALSRIGSAPVFLSGSTLTLHGNPNAALTQNAGTLAVGGFSTLRVEADTAAGANGVSTRLAFADVIRPERGTFGVQLAPTAAPTSRPVSLHLGAGAEDLAGAGTTARNQPILPYAVSTAGSTSAVPPVFVTHDATVGIRALDPITEFSTTLTAGDNVRLDSGGTLAGNLAVNSLLTKGTLGGTGTLTVTSGAILSQGGSINVPLDFGNAEAVIYSWNNSQLVNAATELFFNGAISGSNGLTFTGVPGGAFNRLRLAGSNTFTGPLTINRGEVSFTSLQNLGADNSPITLSAGLLSYRGFSNFILSPEIRTAGIGSRIDTTTGATLTLGSRISGPGSIEFRGKIVLHTANTYEGGTTVAGEVFFNSDAAFGTGGLSLYGVQVGNGTILRPQAPWTTARTIILGGLTETYLDAGAFDVLWNGTISSDLSYSGPFVKRGAGRLTLNANSKFGAALRVEAGTLVVNGVLDTDFLGGAISVNAGAMLTGSGATQRNVTVSGTLDPGDGTGTLSTKNVSFADGSTFALTLDSPASFDRLNVAGTVSLNGQVNLVLQLGYDPADEVDSFTLIDNDGTDAVGGRFAFGGTALEEGALFEAGLQRFQISYAGGTGNDVTARAVPEPNTALLLLAACVFLPRRKAHTR